MTNQEIAPLLAELQRMQRRLDALEAGARTGQLNNASITGAAITVYADDGETPMQQIGLHSDGTVGATAMNGPVPPKPSTPALTPGQLSLTVAWDGTFLDADGDPTPRPVDLQRVHVHVSTSSGFTPDAGTLQGTLAEAGCLVVQPLEVEPQYVQLVSVTTSAVSSDPSAEVTATPLEVVATDLLDGIVTTLKLANDAVTEAKIAADAVTSTQIANNAVTTPKLVAGSVETSKIAAGAVNAGTIAAGAVTTAKLDALAVTAANIAANAVTASKILAGAVTAAKLETDLAVVGTIRSPTYSPGTAGWKVDATSAEFNDVDIRGEVEIGADTGPQVLVNTNPGFGAVLLPTNESVENVPASIFSWDLDYGGGVKDMMLTLQSATVDSPGDGRYMQLRVSSQRSDAGTEPRFVIIENSVSSGSRTIAIFDTEGGIFLNPVRIGGRGAVYQTADVGTGANTTAFKQGNLSASGLAQDAVYEVVVCAAFSTNAAAALQIKTSWTLGSDPITGSRVFVQGPTNSSGEYTSPTNARSRHSTADAAATRTHLISAGGGPQFIVERGLVHTGNDGSGDEVAGHLVAFNFGQNSTASGQTLTMHKYSYMKWRRIA